MTAAAFSTPQRQSRVGVVVMFMDSIRHLLRGFFPFLIILLVNPKSSFAYVVMVGLPLILVLMGIMAWLRYLNFTFYLDPEADEFILQEGVLGKVRTVIALDKIQQVNITQSLIQRLIGVYALEIDTAGSQQKEAVIKAVAHPLALALKAKLLEGGQRAVKPPASGVDQSLPVAPVRPFMQISLASLFKVGVTANYVRSFWILFVFFMTIYDHLRQVPVVSSISTDKIERFFVRQSIVTVAAVSIIGFLFIIMVTNLLRIVVTYFNYRIANENGALLLSFGLINTKSTIVRPERVQIVSVVQNWLQKKMDVLGMRVRQAGSSAHTQHGGGAGHMLEIPGCDASEKDQLLKLLFGVVPEKGAMLTPNWRKLGFSVFLAICLPLIGFYVSAAYMPELYVHQYIAWIYAGFMLVWLWLGYRNYRIYLGDRFVIKKHGVWDIVHDTVEPSKIQAITTSQLFWHKPADIGYLTLHTAAGDVSFQLGDYTQIRRHVNRWLYEMESTDSNWM